MIDIGAGLVARGATESDAETVFQVQAAHNVPVVGDPDGTPEDVVNELIEPGFDLATDGWLVEDDRGVAVGWGSAITVLLVRPMPCLKSCQRT